MTIPERPTHILVVDDEEQIRRALTSILRSRGYVLELAATAQDALLKAIDDPPDLVVLDLMLPDRSGIEVCRELRTWMTAPILILSVRSNEADKIQALDEGADDYLTKPFSVRELIARVHTVLRRPRTATGSGAPAEAPSRVFGDLRLDTAGREVYVAGDPIELTPTEFDILVILASRPKVAFSRQQILDQVWGESWVGDDHVVDVHVANLRRKLGDDPAAPHYVRTVRGVGYRMGQG